MRVSDFKVGQIVEYDGNGNTLAKKGARAIVVGNTSHTYLDIKWVKNSLSNTQSDGAYYPEHFTIITMAPKKQLDFLHKNKMLSNLAYLEALSEK